MKCEIGGLFWNFKKIWSQSEKLRKLRTKWQKFKRGGVNL